jgi:ParB family transcriptional regulator, chromosome partitioning protein
VSNDGAASGGGKRRQLGRGLSSLLGDDEDDVAQVDRLRQTRHVSIEHIEPGKTQPRRTFDETELESLAESIRERGVLQPILLRRVPDGGDRMEIIAGERRWRAAQIAGLHEIPALVRDFSDTEALEIALIENIQRSDLTALEEAEGFQRLIDEYGHTQEDVAQAVGKSRSHIANTLRLLSLSPKAREHLEAGRLTAGHARALLVSEDADRLAEYVVARGLSVRATERLVQGGTAGGSRKPKGQDGARLRPPMEKDSDTKALEKSVMESLGLAVDITPRDADRGTITIQYQTLDQLDDLLARLTAMAPASFMGDDDTGSIFTSDGPMETSFLEGGLENHPLVSADLAEMDSSDSPPVSMDFNTLMAQT